MVVHTCNPSTWEIEAENHYSELLSKTLSQKQKRCYQEVTISLQKPFLFAEWHLHLTEEMSQALAP
jgi:hypothetical protein